MQKKISKYLYQKQITDDELKIHNQQLNVIP